MWNPLVPNDEQAEWLWTKWTALVSDVGAASDLNDSQRNTPLQGVAEVEEEMAIRRWCTGSDRK